MKTFKQFIVENDRYTIPFDTVGIEHEKHSVYKDGRHVINPLSVGIRDTSVKEMYHGDTDMKNMYTPEQCDLNDRLVAHHGYAHSGSTEEHAKALHKYSVKSSSLNEFLHKKHLGIGVQSFDDMANNTHIKKLDKAMHHAKPAPEDYHTYSGIRFNPEDLINDQNRGKGRKGAELRGEEPDHIKVHFPAYTSTTISPHRAQSFSRPDSEGYHHIIKFKIPKGSKHGTHIAGISNFPTEMETLLNRGKNARIHKIPEVKESPAGKVKIWHAELED